MFSLDARGSCGNAVTFSKWLGVNTVKRKAIPSNPKSAAQQSVRGDFQMAVDNWHSLTDAQQSAWAGSAPTGQSGFNYQNGYYMTNLRVGLDPGDWPPP